MVDTTAHPSSSTQASRSSSHTSSHSLTAFPDFSTTTPAPTFSSNSLSSGAIPGIVVGTLVFLAILGAITRRFRRRTVIMQPLPPPLPQTTNSVPAINIYNNNVAPPAPPPAPYYPVTYTPPAPTVQHNGAFNQYVNHNPSYHLPTSWSPPPQQSPSPPVNAPEPNYYGGGKYAVAWDSPAGSSTPHAGPVDHSGTGPPTYKQQWEQ
ncbi:hypothetical protein MVEN_01345200 [Mycena venus]|uniref:Transmembrane protein n=1 Tax=Mycena venus TaxID=2733690 RepID=A0A8H6Y1U0_9AGAR|nr:hypothetical protein MVEN_01345200 [Mycena venus]